MVAPFPSPLRFRPAPLALNTAVIVQLEDSDGAVGLGYAPTLGFGTHALRSHAVEDLAPLITGVDLRDTGAGVTLMAQAAGIAGRLAGTARSAIALLEMALLDIEGQRAGMPLHKLWGQSTDATNAYASGGWRYLSDEELVKFARTRVSQGFRAIKVQVGLSPREDADRLRMVRDVIGPDVGLMLDANRLIPPEIAPEWIGQLATFAPTWIEEPVSGANDDFLSALRKVCAVPLATGESETETAALIDLIDECAVAYIQPDIHRLGLGAATEVCGHAARAGIAIAPHISHEVSAHLVSGAPGQRWLEYFDWFETWWENPNVPERGEVTPSTLPGHGLRLRRGWLDAHRMGR